MLHYSRTSQVEPGLNELTWKVEDETTAAWAEASLRTEAGRQVARLRWSATNPLKQHTEIPLAPSTLAGKTPASIWSMLRDLVLDGERVLPGDAS